MSDDAIETLLEHWARWCAGGQWRPSGRCGSAEGRFLPTRVIDDDARKPQPQPFAEWQLIEVERAIAAMPAPLAKLLRLVYAKRRDPCCAMRLARLQPRQRAAWPVHRSAAFAFLRQRLRA